MDNNQIAAYTPSRKSLLDYSVKVAIRSSLEGNRFAPVMVKSVTMDVRSGTTQFFKSFAVSVDREHVAMILADDDTKQIVRKFFASRAIEKVIEKLIVSFTFSGPNPKFTKVRYFDAVNSIVSNTRAAMVICDITAPGLIKSGLLADRDDFTSREVYPYETATIDSIKAAIATEDLMQLIDASVMDVKVDTAKPNYTAVVAEQIAATFYPVARILNEATLYTDIIDDILLGIRALVDDQGLTLDTSVDRLLRDRPEIADLATNWTYLKAALDLPRTAVTKRTYEMHQQYIPFVVGLIKAQGRFVAVDASQYCSGFSVRQIRDLRGNIVASIFHESARMDKTVTAVTADSDAVTESAWNVRAPRDPIAAKLMGAIGTLPLAYSIDTFSEQAAGILRNVCEQSILSSDENDIGTDDIFGAINGSVFAFVLDQEHVQETMDTFALLSCDEVNIYYDEDARAFNFGFVVQKHEPMYVAKSGYSHGDRFEFSDQNEVILLMGDHAATNQLSHRPQTIPDSVFDTRLIGIERENFVSINERFAFATSVGEVAIHGSLRYGELISLSSTADITVVIPEYNRLVASTATDIFMATVGFIKDLSSVNIYSNLAFVFERDLAYMFDNFTKSLGAAFVAEFRKLIVDRVVAKLSHKESVAMRSRLSTQSYTAMIDVQALALVLERIGVLTSGQVNAMRSVAEIDAVKSNLIEIGRRHKI